MMPNDGGRLNQPPGRRLTVAERARVSLLAFACCAVCLFLFALSFTWGLDRAERLIDQDRYYRGVAAAMIWILQRFAAPVGALFTFGVGASALAGSRNAAVRAFIYFAKSQSYEEQRRLHSGAKLIPAGVGFAIILGVVLLIVVLWYVFN
jgi:hypothetical protein